MSNKDYRYFKNQYIIAYVPLRKQAERREVDVTHHDFSKIYYTAVEAWFLTQAGFEMKWHKGGRYTMEGLPGRGERK